jgi:hypothetical protein
MGNPAAASVDRQTLLERVRKSAGNMTPPFRVCAQARRRRVDARRGAHATTWRRPARRQQNAVFLRLTRNFSGTRTRAHRAALGHARFDRRVARGVIRPAVPGRRGGRNGAAARRTGGAGPLAQPNRPGYSPPKAGGQGRGKDLAKPDESLGSARVLPPEEHVAQPGAPGIFNEEGVKVPQASCFRGPVGGTGPSPPSAPHVFPARCRRQSVRRARCDASAFPI